MDFRDNIETGWTSYYSPVGQFNKKASYIPWHFIVIAKRLLWVGSSKFPYPFNHWPPCWVSQYGWSSHRQWCMLFSSFTQQMLYPGNNNSSQQGWQFKATNTNRDPEAFSHLFFADCLGSYLITSSLPTHFWATGNWNQEEKVIVFIRFWPQAQNQLGV